MGSPSLISKIRDFLAGIFFNLFLKAAGMSKGEYWDDIVESYGRSGKYYKSEDGAK